MRTRTLDAALQTIREALDPSRWPETPAGLIVAYSGGLDSTVLLYALANEPSRQLPLRALHVHHGLQAQADDWAAHCLQQAAAFGVHCDVVRVEVHADGEGLEAAARAARRRAFAHAMQPNDAMVLAQHREDQAETFLLRALRASGPDGLAAMRMLRPFANGVMWRPLLEIPRASLRAYAEAHDLQWIEDPSNAASDFHRNFIRNEVMPLLRQRWPEADHAFATSATWQQQTNDLLAPHDEAALRTAMQGDALQLEPVHTLPTSQRARVFRLWLKNKTGSPAPQRLIDWIEQELARADHDTESETRWGDHLLRRWRSALHCLPSSLSSLPADFEQAWDGREPLTLPTSDRLQLEPATSLPQGWRVRARQGGERIRLPKRAHHSELKSLLQQASLPPWHRAQLPLLFDAEGELQAAGDLFVSAAFSQWLEQHGAQLIWQRHDTTSGTIDPSA